MAQIKIRTINGKKTPISDVKVTGEMSLKELSDARLQEAIDDKNRLPKFLVEALFREKTSRSRHDICGICGDELPDKGTCKRCDAERDTRARDWSTMSEEQRERFFRRHGLENEFSINQQVKLPFSELTKFWQQELKRDGFGR